MSTNLRQNEILKELMQKRMSQENMNKQKVPVERSGHHGLEKNSISNPTYGKMDNSMLITGDSNVETSAHQCSDSSITTEKNLFSSTPALNEPKKATSSLIATPRTNQAQAALNRRRGVRQPTASERECLADAIKTNAVNIVNRVIVKESELPDQLTADGCITEDESSDIIERTNRKDQIRALVSKIHGRDLHVLKNFVKRIEKEYKDIADKINARFEENKRVLVKRATCSCCEMKAYVDIKGISDSLWSIGAISDGLYSEIAHCDKPSGAQNELWIRLIDSINDIREKEQREKACAELVSTLKEKNHYNYIAESIETMISRNKSIACKCNVHYVRTSIDSFHDNTSLYPESSSKSSTMGSGDSCGTLSETEMREVSGTDGNADVVANEQDTPTELPAEERVCRKGVERKHARKLALPGHRRIKFRERHASTADGDVEEERL